MAKLTTTAPAANLRGKVGEMVFCQRADGTTVVRGIGQDTKPSTPGEKKGQHRMKLAHSYVTFVLEDPALRTPYLLEAEKRQKRVCDVVMADYLTDPVIEAVETDSYAGVAGGSVFVILRDEFKVVKVSVVIRNAAGQRLEEGAAAPVGGGPSKVWRFKAATDQTSSLPVNVEVTASDRCGHSAFATVIC